MNLWNLLSKHMVAVVFYMVYVLILAKSIVNESEYQLILKRNHGVWPYGVREDGLLFPLFGCAFLFITCLYAIAAKENKFYLWLIALIITPFIIGMNYLFNLKSILANLISP